MANDSTKIKLEPVDVTWGQPEVTKVVCVADSSDDLDGTYFTLSTPTTDYYVWMDGVAAADPALDEDRAARGSPWGMHRD